MKIAIAGAGDMAKYFSEEFSQNGIEVVILSRSEKSWVNNMKDVNFRLVDFNSVDSIKTNIDDCDGVISAILDYTMDFTKVHLTIIEAITKSAKCRKFIPSEFGGNLHKYPDQPIFYFENHEPIREKLRRLSRDQIEWTLLNVGWLSDYLIPQNKRYIKDIGDAFPINLMNNTAVIPGTGEESISFTSARDIAHAAANLFLTEEPWEDIIYVCGETSCWNRILENLEYDVSVSYRSLGTIVKTIVESSIGEDYENIIIAEYQLMSCSGAGELPKELVDKHRKKYFQDIKFRDIRELINCADAADKVIV